jgi:hypothetical protein
MNVGKIYGRMMASSFSDKGSLHLQEYMKTEHTESPEYDPQSLRGYNYLVCSNYNVNVTVSQVWMSNEGLLGSSEGTRLKELCLSFALFRLLRRRFFKVACPEAKLLKTHDLIFKGMLLDVEENCQVYRIIETELAFIHDHFFTTSTFQHTTLGQLSMIANIIFIISYTLLIRTNIRNFLSWKDEPMLPMNSRNIPGGRVGIIIIGVTMLLSLAFELLRIYVHVSSDWAMVERACSSMSRKFTITGFYIYRHWQTKLRQPFGHWQNKIGQHSLLMDLHCRSVTSFTIDVMGSLFSVFQRFVGYVPAPPRGIHHPGVKEPDNIPLTDDVKLAIGQTLKASNGHLSNGASSLRHNDLDEVSLWACQHKNQAANLVIWHIATEYCGIAQSIQEAEPEGLYSTILLLLCQVTRKNKLLLWKYQTIAPI